ncbi:MAG: aldo/keto reductase [Mycobacteriales bacterium]
MRTSTLGRTGVTVTELGLGGGPLGNLYAEVEDATARATVDAAWEAGVRYFDTAPHYGLGLAERRLGAALADKPRAEYAVSTKIGRLLEPNPRRTGSDLAAGGFAVPDDLRRRWDFSADGVRRSLAASLQRLGLDRVDVLLVHDADEHVDQAIAEAIPALVELRDQGVVGAVGVGMNQWQAPLRMVTETPIDVVMLAGRWTLLDRSGAPLLEACAERGVSVLAAAPYNSGLLARPRPTAESFLDYVPVRPDPLERATALADACDRHGVELPAAALRFPLRHPAVAAVVAGVRSPNELTAAVDRVRTPIPGQLWTDLQRWTDRER